MREIRRLLLHLVLLTVAAGWAYVESGPKDASSRPLKPGEVELWAAKPADVSLVRYEGKGKAVVLEQKTDQAGTWFLGKVEPIEADAPEEVEAPDAGKPKPKPKPVEPKTFVSVKAGNKLIEKLAPLRAKRAIGVLSEDREKAFGLDEPEGTLRVTIKSKEHVLTVGSTKLGSGLRYVRDESNKQVYVIDGKVVSDMSGGAARLTERTVHEWKITDVSSAVIAAGDKRREVMRGGTEGRRFWADVSTPETNDETVNNWLTKLNRLRPSKYRESLPEGAVKVCRVDFTGKKKALGFVELYRHVADGDEKKAEFFIISEQQRLYASVTKSVAEQVADDLSSVLPSEAAE